MLLEVHPAQSSTAALPKPLLAARGRGEPLAALLRGWDRPAGLRAALVAAACFGIVAFILGGGNRFTQGPWFLYIPEVSLIPPIGRAAWEQAFVVHRQSPLYALCGGYEAGGMESVTIYRFLYAWEWLRIASTALFAAALCLAWFGFAARAVKSAERPALRPWLIGLAAGIAYLGLRYFADHAGLFASINIGQHRHALDVTFASAGLGLLIAGALSQELLPATFARAAWACTIALDIAFGALFEALDARPLWTSFPGYTDSLLPDAGRLFALHPVWRNVTENGYLIQACHRVLSIGLWAAAALAMVTALLRGRAWMQPAALFALLTLEGALGVATLQAAEQPVVLSIAHQACAIAVFAAALMQMSQKREGEGSSPRAARHPLAQAKAR